MPLSELWRFAAGKLESGQQRSFPADNSSLAGNDLVELVWENGQIMMQSQSNRGTGGPGLNSIPSNTNRICDATAGQPTTSRIGKFDGVESMLDDMSSVVPSGELDLSQDDEMVPWLNYPMGDGLPQDYVSDLLPEISGVTGNGMSAQNSFISMEKRSNCDGNVNNLSSGGNVLKALSSSSKARPLFSWSVQHCQSSDAVGSGVSNFTGNNAVNGHDSAAFGNSPQGKAMVNESVSMEMERPDMGLPTSNSNFLNFPYFSRPAIITKANPRYCDGAATSVSPGVVKIDAKDRGSASSGNSPPKSPFVGPRKDIDFGASSSKITLVDSRKQVVEKSKEIQLPERAENISKEPPVKNEKPVILGHIACPTKEILDGDRNVEPTFISSSVGSGYSADRVSNERTHNSKRTFHDIEESECRSDDIETASVGVKKATPARLGSSSKRSRAAEVHNLSERRRRDRINEKMRALQELIPNCNKVDKASMLDEAIEYLKTLQLQVQIMSMGAGLCLPPRMMLPLGMQQMHPPHFPHFSPMGVGMGLGMGFGMGIRDMGGGSPGYPIFPVPHAQVAHFPSMTGPSNFQRIPVPNLPVYGHPSPGHPNSVPRAPAVPVARQPPVVPGTVLCGPALNLVDPLTNKNTQPKLSAEASNPNHKPDQIKVPNEVLDQPTTVQGNQQASDARAPASLTTTTQTDITKETSEHPL